MKRTKKQLVKTLERTVNRIDRHLTTVKKQYQTNMFRKRKSIISLVGNTKKDLHHFDYGYAYYLGKFVAYLFVLNSLGGKFKLSKLARKRIESML